MWFLCPVLPPAVGEPTYSYLFRSLFDCPVLACSGYSQLLIVHCPTSLLPILILSFIGLWVKPKSRLRGSLKRSDRKTIGNDDREPLKRLFGLTQRPKIGRAHV